MDFVYAGSTSYLPPASSHFRYLRGSHSTKSSKSPQFSVLTVISSLTVVFGFLIAMVITAWSVRGLTLILGRSKTNPVNRLDDVALDESLPLNELPPENETPDTPRRSSEVTFDVDHVADSLPQPSRTAEASRIRGPGTDLPTTPQGSSANLLQEYQHVRPPTRAQKITAIITAYLDVLTWSILWIIGLGIYLGTGYSMPAQLPLNILTFFGAMRIPASVRRFIHPIFPCAGFTILGIFILAAMKAESLDQGSFSRELS